MFPWLDGETMSKQKTKGGKFERDIAQKLAKFWPDAKRGLGQARSGDEVSDVEGTPFWIECKHWRKCSPNTAYDQAEKATDGRPVLVVTKDDRRPVLVTMTLDEWMDLVEKAKEKELCRVCQSEPTQA